MSVTKPTLTVITVCLNAVSTIRECIQSVAEGKSQEVEYLIIDGGSTDDTLKIVHEFSNVVDLLISEPDAGIFDAMNKGILKANGEYIAFLNADDTYLPGAIKTILEALLLFRDAADVIYGDWLAVGINGVLYERKANHRLTWRYSLCHQAIVAKRDIFPIPCAFDLRYRFCADFNLILLWQAKKNRFKHLDLPLVKFSEAGASAKFFRRSSLESISITLRQGRTLWVPVFVVRVAFHLFRVSMAVFARRFS